MMNLSTDETKLILAIRMRRNNHLAESDPWVLLNVRQMILHDIQIGRAQHLRHSLSRRLREDSPDRDLAMLA